MNLKIVTIIWCFFLSLNAICQSDSKLNQTDQSGKKQGHWIKKYPDQSTMYDGYFKDDHPVGEFRRYFENHTLSSLLNYSSDGRKTVATIYHPNGNISSKGTFVNQKKEGKWQFFSEFTNGYLVSEEYYRNNIRDGLSSKFYPDSTIAEKLTYLNDVRQGEWTQYFPSGKLRMKTFYEKGKINGTFQVWFENGKIELSGQYKDDYRDGLWIVYNNDGTVKYKLTYLAGITTDRQMDIDESDFLDSLENNKGKIADPEKNNNR